MTEDYVNFETAKLLKEKGFDETCTHVCNIESGKILEADFYTSRYVYNSWLDKNEPQLIAVPTLQMAMKWLREVHHIVLVVDYDYECTDKSYCYKVYRLGENGKPERVPIYGVGYDIEGNQYRELVSYRDYERSRFEYVKYEEACEAAIKYCLENLI